MLKILCKKIQDELLKTEKEITLLQNQLSSLPEGTLVCTKNGKYFKCYQRNGSSLDYIPKSNLSMAQKLAQKKYLLFRLADCRQEKRAIEAYLKIHRKLPRAPRLLDADSPYHILLSTYFSPASSKLSQWACKPYETNNSFPEQRMIKSCSGNTLRSKSEALIDMALYTNRIPFRYECALNLGNKTLFPDFTIRHPETGEFFYWEHFGMMSDPTYSQKTFDKLLFYNSHGITPSVNLITTYETLENPLSPEYVQALIRHYFL